MNHPIPDEALDADIAILGKKGRGKTYAAKGIVERLLDMERRVVILDPLSTWWGLRTSADGKGAGYPVAVFGGPHGDMPLNDKMGTALAQTLATTNLPSVIDLGEMTKAATVRFARDFLAELFRKNRDPLWLILEEADLLAPQNPMGDTAAVLAEVDRIARRGRAFGFRLITMTQRPARLHKDVLTQLSTLIAMGVSSPQDRDAIKAWVEGNADRDEAKEVTKTLASLKVGEGWVWAPDHDILKRVKFPPIKTLDTSRTPKVGEKRIEQVKLAEVDLSAIHDALASEPEENPSKTKAPSEKALKDAESVGFDLGLAAGEKRGYTQGYAVALSAAQQAVNALRVSGEIENPVDTPKKRPAPVTTPTAMENVTTSATDRSTLKGAHQRIIDAIAWWHTAGDERVKRSVASVVAGYSPKASTFGVYIGELVKDGLVDTASASLALTEEGRKVANWVPASTDEYIREKARKLLKPRPLQVFDVIYQKWPDEIRRHDVAIAVELSPISSTVGVYIGVVAAFGLIEASSPGCVRAADWLFERGN